MLAATSLAMPAFVGAQSIAYRARVNDACLLVMPSHHMCDYYGYVVSRPLGERTLGPALGSLALALKDPKLPLKTLQGPDPKGLHRQLIDGSVTIMLNILITIGLLLRPSSCSALGAAPLRTCVEGRLMVMVRSGM